MWERRAELSGQTFFFYGSLMDVELLEAVLCRKADSLSFTPGWLNGYIAETALGYSFPTLIERSDARAHGIITAGLSTDDVARIAYFEDTEYDTVAHSIATARRPVTAHVFMANASLRSSGEAWNFDAWRKRDKPLLLAVTRRVMSEHYGVTPFEEVDAHWHRIKAEIEAGMRPARKRAASKR